MVDTKLFSNYIKITFRNLKRNKFYASINVFGLAIGITCFTLILLFIRDELSYDQFHTKKERIFRVCEQLDSEEGQGENSSSQPFPVAQALLNDYPHLVEEAVRFFNFQESSHTISYKETTLNEQHTFFADSSVFKVFDFPLLKGDPAQALTKVNSIVLSPTFAKKYFGDEDPMGKILKFDGKLDLMVTGIFAEVPAQSHIHFDCLVSMVSLKNILGPNIGSKNWVWNPCWTYILLKNKTDAVELEAQFPDFIIKHFPDFIVPQATLYLQKLTDIHLTSKLAYELEQNSDKDDLFIFGGIGLFILIIACINYMNLATARSAKRAKEVGMRKVFGSYRRHLVQQFLGESLVMSFLALLTSLLLTALILPLFNSLSGKDFSFAILADLQTVMMLLIITGAIGILAGLYPAFFLSAFQPMQVLKGVFSGGSRSKLLRQGLVVLQFTISLSLIIGTVVIYKQLQFLRSADLGFAKDQILVMPVRPPMAASYLPFMEELKTSGRIVNVTTMNDMLGVSHNTHEYNYEGMSPNKQWIYFPSLIVGPTFIQTMDIKIVAGRAFDESIKSDDSLAVIINEAMVDHLGWGSAENAIGKQFFTPHGKERVVGVAKNFNFVSLKESVGPFVLDIAGKFGKLFWIKYILIRIPPNDVNGTINYLETKWKDFSNEYPFEYFFLDETINKTYKGQDNLGKLVAYFSVLTIFIACLGLFALASFTAEQRTKEIGIRKVLGAPTSTLVKLMSKEFLFLVALSALISWPITWFLMRNWLNNFAYKTSMSFGIFIAAALVGLFIAFITVLFHALRSALSNPVKALKYE